MLIIIYYHFKHYYNYNQRKKKEVNKIMKRSLKNNPFSRLFDTISSCMKPVIPVLMAAGILKLLIILIGYTGLFTLSPQTEDVLSAVSNAAFYFLPVFTAYSSACHFRVNPAFCHGMCGGSSAARFYRAFEPHRKRSVFCFFRYIRLRMHFPYCLLSSWYYVLLKT